MFQPYGIELSTSQLVAVVSLVLAILDFSGLSGRFHKQLSVMLDKIDEQLTESFSEKWDKFISFCGKALELSMGLTYFIGLGLFYILAAVFYSVFALLMIFLILGFLTLGTGWVGVILVIGTIWTVVANFGASFWSEIGTILLFAFYLVVSVMISAFIFIMLRGLILFLFKLIILPFWLVFKLIAMTPGHLFGYLSIICASAGVLLTF